MSVKHKRGLTKTESLRTAYSMDEKGYITNEPTNLTRSYVCSKPLRGKSTLPNIIVEFFI